MRMLHPSPLHMVMDDETVFTQFLVFTGLQHYAAELSLNNSADHSEVPAASMHNQNSYSISKAGQRAQQWQASPGPRRSEPRRKRKRTKQTNKTALLFLSHQGLVAHNSPAMRSASLLCHYDFDTPFSTAMSERDVKERVRTIAMVAARDLEQLYRHFTNIDVPSQLRL